MDVTLISRSFNDLDCRLPLVLQLQQHSNINVKVIIIPTSTSSGLTVKHDAALQLVSDITHFVNIGVKGWKLKLLELGSKIFEQSQNEKIKGIFWSRFWRVFYRTLIKTNNVKNIFEKTLENSIVIIDEIMLQNNRSIVTKWISEFKAPEHILCMQHGQNLYLNLWYEKKVEDINLKRKLRFPIFSASSNDRRLLLEKIDSSLVHVVGNTRFDKKWIKKLENEIFPEPHQDLPKYNGIKVSFLMSKMEYGLQEDEVYALINEISELPNVKLVLKPHTRGMVISNSRLLKKQGVIVAGHISSSQIIDWSDIVLGTGSSIFLEAIVKNKHIIYLQKLQKYKMLLEELPDSCRLMLGEHFSKKLIKWDENGDDALKARNFILKHSWNNIEDGNICECFIDNHILTLLTDYQAVSDRWKRDTKKINLVKQL